MDYLGFQWITFQMLFTNCTTCVQDIGDKQEVSKSNNNNNNNKMTETTTRTKKIEEEEEYGGVKVLHEFKFEVGNQLLNLKKNTVKMNVDNTRIEQINQVKHSRLNNCWLKLTEDEEEEVWLKVLHGTQTSARRRNQLTTKQNEFQSMQWLSQAIKCGAQHWLIEWSQTWYTQRFAELLNFVTFWKFESTAVFCGKSNERSDL